jgi:hypothetical protein
MGSHTLGLLFVYFRDAFRCNKSFATTPKPADLPHPITKYGGINLRRYEMNLP